MGWGLFELLTSTQMNVIDSQLPLAVDSRGGSYTLLAPLGFDGSALTSGPTFDLSSGALIQPAFRLVNGGTGPTMELHSLDTTGHDYLLYLHSEDVNDTDAETTLYVAGRENTGGDGGPGAQISGGSSSFAGSDGATGLILSGGSAFATGQGGRALQASGGSANFTDAAGSGRFGRSAVRVDANYTYGADASLHYGAAAAELYGSQMIGPGKGGAGLISFGGVGPSNVVNGADAGPGVVGVGSTGVLGILSGSIVDYRPLPSEFLQGARAGVRAVAQTLGRAFLSEMSGNSSDAEINYLKWVGAGSAGGGKTLLKVEAATATAPASLSTGLVITSGVNSGVFRGADIFSREAVSLRLSAQGGAGNVNIHAPLLLLSQSVEPNVFDQGGLTYVSAGALTGLSSGGFLMGHGPGTGYFDRIVGSADSAAAWAWARIRTNGSGGATLVAGYNVASVAIQGTTQLQVNLNAITGGPADGDKLAVTSTSNNTAGYGGSNKSGTIDVLISDGQTLLAQVFDRASNAAYDLTTNIVDITVIVYALPLFGRVATRPTFYRP